MKKFSDCDFNIKFNCESDLLLFAAKMHFTAKAQRRKEYKQHKLRVIRVHTTLCVNILSSVHHFQFMKKVFFFLFITFTLSDCFAQSMERKIINSNGSVMTASGITMKTSLGEPVVGKKGTTTSMISQGFYTGSFVYVVNGIPNSPNNSISIFPNPASDRIYFNGNINAVNSAEVFNTFGMKIFSGTINSNSIELSQLAAGIYFINLLDTNHKIISSSKFIKISL